MAARATPHPAPPVPQPGPRPRASAPVLILSGLAMLFAAWAARDVLLPVLLAMFFALIANPLLRALRRLRIPTFAAAVLLLGAGIVLVVLLGRQLAAPATEWIQQLPSELQVLTPKLQQVTGPMQQASEAAATVA